MAEPGDPDLFKDKPAPRPEADPDADTTTFEDGPWRVVRTRTDVTRVEVR